MQVEPNFIPPRFRISDEEKEEIELVTITKVPSHDQLYCGYTNGTVKVLSTNSGKTIDIIHLYQSGEVIDI